MIEQAPSATPPASPVIGQCFLVGAGATGAWAGQDGALAGFSEGGWRFVPPTDGVAVLVRSSGETMLRRAGAWETGIARIREVRVNGQTVVRDRQAAVAGPTGGATVDAEARSAIAGVLAALRAHGLIAP